MFEDASLIMMKQLNWEKSVCCTLSLPPGSSSAQIPTFFAVPLLRHSDVAVGFYFVKSQF